ncbi:MAG: carbon-nitrogen hydrolase family protein [Anaerolineae bacterium]
MREVTVAVVQMHPRLADISENLVHMSQLIEEICSRQKTDLVVFPELATTGYECGVRFTELAERVPGPTVNIIAQRAQEFNTHVAFGMVAKEKVESILYNAAILVGPDGELIGDYRKVHLRGEERLAFRPGYRYQVFETNFGQVGLLLGWDLAFPETARSLALDGAELLCVLANWEQPHIGEWRSYVLARAYENSIFVAAANRVGEEYTYSFFGQSMIVGPRGGLHAAVDEEGEGYGVARIDLDEVRKYREEFQFLQCRQPSTYRAIVRKY